MPLNQETINILPDVLIALRNAIESAFLYPANNQARIDYRDEAFRQLSQTLNLEKVLTFSVVEGALLVNAQELEREGLKNALGAAFAQYLFNHRISSITFKADLAESEFAFFLDCIIKDEDFFYKVGGLQKLFRDNNIISLDIDFVRYDKACHSLGRFKYPKGILEAMLLCYPNLRALIDGKGKIPPKERTNREMEEILNSFSGLIGNICGLKTQVNEKAEMILEALRIIIDPLEKPGSEEWDKFKAGFANIFFSCEPEVKAVIIKKYLSDINAPGAVINDIISSGSDQEIIEVVSDNLKKSNLPFEDLSDMLKVVFSDPERKARLAPVIEQRMKSMGLSKQDIAILLSREFVQEKVGFEFLNPEFMRRVYSEHPPVQAGADTQSYIQSLILEDKEDEIVSLIQEMAREFEHAPTVTRGSIIKDFENILAMLMSADKSQILLKTTFKIIELLDKEISQQEYQLIVGEISEIIKGLLYKENYSAANDLIADLKPKGKRGKPQVRKVIQDAFSNIIDTRIKSILILALEKETVYSQTNILGVTVEMGGFILDLLFQILQEENTARDPFQLHVRRKRVALVLRKIGKEAVDKIKEKLSMPDSPEIKHIVEVSGYLEDRSIVPSFLNLISHDDSSVREKLVTALKRLWGKESLGLLVMLLKDPNSRVRNKAIAVLMEMTDKSDLIDVERLLAEHKIGNDAQGLIEYIRKK